MDPMDIPPLPPQPVNNVEALAEGATTRIFNHVINGLLASMDLPFTFQEMEENHSKLLLESELRDATDKFMTRTDRLYDPYDDAFEDELPPYRIDPFGTLETSMIHWRPILDAQADQLRTTDNPYDNDQFMRNAPYLPQKLCKAFKNARIEAREEYVKRNLAPINPEIPIEPKPLYFLQIPLKHFYNAMRTHVNFKTKDANQFFISASALPGLFEQDIFGGYHATLPNDVMRRISEYAQPSRNIVEESHTMIRTHAQLIAMHVYLGENMEFAFMNDANPEDTDFPNRAYRKNQAKLQKASTRQALYYTYGKGRKKSGPLQPSARK